MLYGEPGGISAGESQKPPTMADIIQTGIKYEFRPYAFL